MGFVYNVLNIFFLVVLIAGVYMYSQQKKEKNKETKEFNTTVNKKYDFRVEGVESFLDFDRIYNNMIIRKNGSMFTMVINCSGINYDLMSADEKIMIEEAFIELLNFLRFPIQLYVQTRKVDLKDSLKTYGEKIRSIEKELNTLTEEYDSIKLKNPEDTEKLGMLSYEMERKQNLLEYAIDLKDNIEKMSINKNVLQYKYYIVLTYRIEEIGLMTNFTEKEILDMAFTELLTRSQSIVGALMGCSIEAKILNSNELAELLYVAFNRDDAELYRLKDNMEAGFYRLFSTTESALTIKQASPVSVEIGLDDQLYLLNEKYSILDEEVSEAYLLESAKDQESA